MEGKSIKSAMACHFRRHYVNCQNALGHHVSRRGRIGGKMDYYSSYKKTPVPRISDEKILERILTLKRNSSISPNVFSFVSSLAAGFKKYGGVTQKQYEAFCDVEESYLHTESKTSEAKAQGPKPEAQGLEAKAQGLRAGA